MPLNDYIKRRGSLDWQIIIQRVASKQPGEQTDKMEQVWVLPEPKGRGSEAGT